MYKLIRKSFYLFRVQQSDCHWQQFKLIKPFWGVTRQCTSESKSSSLCLHIPLIWLKGKNRLYILTDLASRLFKAVYVMLEKLRKCALIVVWLNKLWYILTKANTIATKTHEDYKISCKNFSSIYWYVK